MRPWDRSREMLTDSVHYCFLSASEASGCKQMWIKNKDTVKSPPSGAGSWWRGVGGFFQAENNFKLQDATDEKKHSCGSWADLSPGVGLMSGSNQQIRPFTLQRPEERGRGCSIITLEWKISVHKYNIKDFFHLIPQNCRWSDRIIKTWQLSQHLFEARVLKVEIMSQ